MQDTARSVDERQLANQLQCKHKHTSREAEGTIAPWVGQNIGQLLIFLKKIFGQQPAAKITKN